MHRTSRIFVAGHRGLVGSAVVRILEQEGFRHLILRDRNQLDLCDRSVVKTFFSETSPDVVILCAAKVGGISSNLQLAGEFIEKNLAIQTNVIAEAYLQSIRELLFLGSSCIYPRDCPQPIEENFLLSGTLEPSNRPYAVAKIAGIEMCWAYNRQYGTRYLTVMPSNLYGPFDNYDSEHSHVIPGILQRVHHAQLKGARSVSVWGSGTPRREFLYSDDLARACVFLLTRPTSDIQGLFNDLSPPLINVGPGTDITVHELAEIICEIVGFNGDIEWDRTKPDGTPRKLLSTSQINKFGWKPSIDLRQGITIAYQDFLNRHE